MSRPPPGPSDPTPRSHVPSSPPPPAPADDGVTLGDAAFGRDAGLSVGVAAVLRAMRAPPPPPDLRARILAAADAPTRVLRFPGAGRLEGGRILAFVGAAAAAAAVVFAVGSGVRTRAAADPAWEALHPEAKAPPVRVRVVDDPAPADWTSASIVNASFDPLDGP